MNDNQKKEKLRKIIDNLIKEPSTLFTNYPHLKDKLPLDITKRVEFTPEAINILVDRSIEEEKIDEALATIDLAKGKIRDIKKAEEWAIFFLIKRISLYRLDEMTKGQITKITDEDYTPNPSQVFYFDDNGIRYTGEKFFDWEYTEEKKPLDYVIQEEKGEKLIYTHKERGFKKVKIPTEFRIFKVFPESGSKFVLNEKWAEKFTTVVRGFSPEEKTDEEKKEKTKAEKDWKRLNDIGKVPFTYENEEGEQTVNDFKSYEKYLEYLEIVTKSEFDPEPYKIDPRTTIETYEQFKWNIHKTLSTDFLIKKEKGSFQLTNLCSFVEKYLKQEPLHQQKRHLIEVLQILSVDLATYKPNFWDRIKQYVETPLPGVAPALQLIPEIQVWLQEVRDFITARYAAYLHQDPITGKYPMCTNINFFLSDVEAIINDLKIRLINIYYRLVNNPLLFKTNLKTNIQTNLTDNEESGRGGGTSREKSLQKILETEVEETPLKTSIAENMGAWGAYKAQLSKNQAKENTQENVRFDKETREEKSKRSKQRGETKDISRDVVLDSRILEFLGNAIEKLAIYEDIGKKLDKYFSYSEWKTLSEWEKELGIED